MTDSDDVREYRIRRLQILGPYLGASLLLVALGVAFVLAVGVVRGLNALLT